MDLIYYTRYEYSMYHALLPVVSYLQVLYVPFLPFS